MGGSDQTRSRPLGVGAMGRADLVIAFSGAIGSGKTSLSRAVADAVRCPRVSFGVQVREEARLRGLDDSRETLQQLGESLVLTQMERFCRSVIAQAPANSHAPLLIDGLRHVAVLDFLCALVAPRPLYLVYIELDQAARSVRIAGDVSTWDAHSTEVQVPSALRAQADLNLDGNDDLPRLCSTVVSWMESLPS